MPRLDLQPAGAAPAGLVGRVERLRPPRPRGPSATAAASTSDATGRGRRSPPAAPAAARGPPPAAPRPARRPAGRARPSPSACRTSKKYVDNGAVARAAATSTRDDTRLPVSWNGRGRPSGRSAIASPSRTSSRTGSDERGLDHLGHPVGDLVQAAGPDRDVRAGAVHLHADAVQLPLDGRLPQPAERVLDVGGRRGEHRLHGPADLQPERGQPRRALGQRRLARPDRPPRAASRPGVPRPAARPQPGRRRPASRPRARPGAAHR